MISAIAHTVTGVFITVNIVKMSLFRVAAQTVSYFSLSPLCRQYEKQTNMKVSIFGKITSSVLPTFV